MIYKIANPTKALSPFIRFYWYVAEEERSNEQTKLILPDGCSELIFCWNKGYNRKDLQNDNSNHSVVKSCFTGQLNESIVATNFSKTGIIGVKFEPFSPFLFFGIPQHHFNNKIVNLSELGMKDCKELEHQLYGKSFKQAKVILDKHFLNSIAACKDSENEILLLTNILKQIVTKEGNLKVNDLSYLYGIHRRTIIRLFDKYIGLQPKRFINLIRFRIAFKSFRNIPDQSNSYLSNGFYDQSHFIKFFKYFIGTTPNKFINSRFDFDLQLSLKSEF